MDLCCSISQRRNSDSPKVNILIAVTGGLAATKIPEFVKQLKRGFLGGGSPPHHGPVQILLPFIKVIGTEHAFNFFSADDLISHDSENSATDHFGPTDSGYHCKVPPVEVYQDSDEWAQWKKDPRDPVLHIKLVQWADVLIVAPLDANTLAKIALGLADNLVTCVIRNWEINTLDKLKPVLLVPAMSINMWLNPLTKKHIKTLKEFGFDFIPSPPKNEDTTYGALSEPLKLAEYVVQKML